jgi:uncharacterized membrane protein YcaP (DUF421 family)
MWIFDFSLLEVVLRTVIIYIVILVGIRLTGKREVGQMASFDLVLLMLIANAVQNAMTGPDTSVSGGLVAAVTLLLINVLLSRFSVRSRKIMRVLEGVPTILIRDGRQIGKNLKREHVALEELEQSLREHGIASIDDVGLATLEVDGSISVLKKDELPSIARPHHHIRFLVRKHG